jgi:gluconolactonase
LYRSPQGDVQKIGENFAYSNGIALSPDGETVLVANFTAKEVVALPSMATRSPFATTYLFARTQGGIGPDGLRTDRSGNVFVANLGAGEVDVLNMRGQPLGTIKLPESAGLLTSNVALGRRYLFIVEAAKGEVWRVEMTR